MYSPEQQRVSIPRRRITRRRYVVDVAILASTTIVAACGSTLLSPTAAPPAPSPSNQTVSVKPTTPLLAQPARPPTATAPATSGQLIPVTTPAPDVAGNVTTRILISASVTDQPLLDKLSEQWAKAYSNGSTIQWVSMPGASLPQVAERLQTMIAGGDPPDLVSLESGQTLQFCSKGAFAALDPLIQRDHYDLSDFFEKGIQQYIWKGVTYTLPRGMSNQLIYVNVDKFKEAGLALPPADVNVASWTWSAFADLAQKLTRRDPSGRVTQYGFMLRTGQLRGGIGQWIWANGGEFFNKDYTQCTLNDKAAAALQFMQDLIYKYKVSPGPAEGNAITFDDEFLTGRAAMIIAPAANVQSYRKAKFDWDYAANPRGDGPPVTTGGGQGLSIIKGIKQPATAWEVLKYIVSPESLKFMSATWYPARKSALDYLEGLDPKLPPHRRDIARQGQEIIHPDPATPLWLQIDQQIIEKELSLVWLDKESGAEAVKKIVPQVNDFLQKNQP